MKVKELISKLGQCNPEATIERVYSTNIDTNNGETSELSLARYSIVELNSPGLEAPTHERVYITLGYK